jgi:hypothetical protein
LIRERRDEGQRKSDRTVYYFVKKLRDKGLKVRIGHCPLRKEQRSARSIKQEAYV